MNQLNSLLISTSRIYQQLYQNVQNISITLTNMNSAIILILSNRLDQQSNSTTQIQSNLQSLTNSYNIFNKLIFIFASTNCYLLNNDF